MPLMQGLRYVRQLYKAWDGSEFFVSSGALYADARPRRLFHADPRRRRAGASVACRGFDNVMRSLDVVNTLHGVNATCVWGTPSADALVRRFGVRLFDAWGRELCVPWGQEDGDDAVVRETVWAQVKLARTDTQSPFFCPPPSLSVRSASRRVCGCEEGSGGAGRHSEHSGHSTHGPSSDIRADCEDDDLPRSKRNVGCIETHLGGCLDLTRRVVRRTSHESVFVPRSEVVERGCKSTRAIHGHAPRTMMLDCGIARRRSLCHVDFAGTWQGPTPADNPSAVLCF
eukprot:404305-Rhodomonas_salina.5